MLPKELVGEGGYPLHFLRPVGASAANAKPRDYCVGGAINIQNLTHKTLAEKLRVRVYCIPLTVIGCAAAVVACVRRIYGVADPLGGYDLTAAESASVAINHPQFYYLCGRYAQPAKCPHSEVLARV